eukprot:870071-Pleurochrysis_carterae.AAC.3
MIVLDAAERGRGRLAQGPTRAQYHTPTPRSASATLLSRRPRLSRNPPPKIDAELHTYTTFTRALTQGPCGALCKAVRVDSSPRTRRHEAYRIVLVL